MYFSLYIQSLVDNSFYVYCKNSLENLYTKLNGNIENTKRRLLSACFGSIILRKDLGVEEVEVLKQIDGYYRSLEFCLISNGKKRDDLLKGSKKFADTINLVMDNMKMNPTSRKRDPYVSVEGLHEFKEKKSNIIPFSNILKYLFISSIEMFSSFISTWFLTSHTER